MTNTSALRYIVRKPQVNTLWAERKNPCFRKPDTKMVLVFWVNFSAYNPCVC